MKTKNFLILLFNIIIATNFFAQSPDKFISQTKTQLNNVKFYDNTKAQNLINNNIFSYKISEKLMTTVVITTTNDFTCIDCYTYISVFVFKKNNNTWQLIEKKIKLHAISKYGMIPLKEEIMFKTLTDTTFLMYYELVDNKNTFSIARLKTYYFTGTKLVNSGEIIIGKNNSISINNPNELNVWQAEYTIKKLNNNLPKIILNVSGYKGQNTYTNQKVYIFDKKENKFIEI